MGHSSHVVRQLLGDVHHPHTGGALGHMAQGGHAVGAVFDDLVHRDRPGGQVNVIPGQSGQLPTAQAGEHHNDRHRLGTVGSVPYPPLFFRGQGAAFFFLTASKGKVYLGFGVGGDDPANSTAHDLPDGGAVEVHSPL